MSLVVRAEDRYEPLSRRSGSARPNAAPTSPAVKSIEPHRELFAGREAVKQARLT